MSKNEAPTLNGRLLLMACCLLGGASARAADPSLREQMQAAWQHPNLPLHVPMRQIARRHRWS